MARRVNTKFLIILTVVVVGVLVAALVITKLRRGDPAKYIAQGSEAVNQQRFDDAAQLYKQALSIDGKRPDVWIAYGDVQRQLVYKDAENVGRAVRAWQQALELDPNNKEALTRMLAVYQDDSENGAPASTIEKGRDVAQRLLKLDPNNKLAAAALPQFTLRAAASGVDANPDPQKLIDAVKQLADLSAAQPEDPDLAKLATEAKLALAQALGRSQPAEARKAVEEAAQLMETSLKAAPNSAAMQFQAATIFALAAGLPDSREKYEGPAKAAMAEAIKLARPEDEPYAQIQVAAARQAFAERDRERGEKILRALLDVKPDDLPVRLQAAELIASDPAKRREAIEILERPVTARSVDARRFVSNSRAELTLLVLLANLRMDEYAANTDPAARQKLEPAIEDGISKFVARVPGGADNPFALRLRGKFQRVKGDNVAAIQTLNKALNLLEQQQKQQRDATYYDTVDLLARAYMDTQQFGSARELLTQIVSDANLERAAPGRVLFARLMLARLLIQQRDMDAAREQVDLLEKALPDSADVMKLRLATLDREKEKERVKELYARLPEKTRAEAFEKANIAAQIGDFAEAQRLVAAELAKTPGDPEASVALARVYGAQNDKEKAAAIIADALKAHPDNKLLQLAQKQLANATPEEMRQFRLESIEQIADPAQKALQLAEVALADGKPDEALKQLQEAEKASPDNLRVKEALFNQYLARKQWDDATRCLESLAKANGDQAGGLLYRVRFATAKAQSAETPATRQAELDKALAHARDLTQRLPEFGQSWLVLGQALQAVGKLDEATQRYATALEKQPASLEAMRGMVECYGMLNRPADVKRYIDAALKISPNNAYFGEQLTTYELNFGDPTKALAAREAFVKRAPENPQAWGMLAEAYRAAYQHKSGKQDETGAKEMLTKAADTYKQAIAKFPDDARFYGGYADVALALKDSAAAEATLKQLAARDAWKDKPEPQLMMVQFLLRTGKPDDAEAMLKSLVAKDPANVTAQLNLASLLAQRGKVDDALAALQANASDPRVREQLVRLQIGTNKLEEADKTIQAALAADPKAVGYQALAGFVSLRRGRWEEADQRLNAALKLDPRNPMALFYTGQLRLYQPTPNVDEAIQYLTTARDTQVDAAMMVDIRLTLAEALRRRGDSDGAARELEAALAAQPMNKQIRRALVGVYMPPKPQTQRLGDAERIIREGRELAKDDPDLMQLEAALWLNRGDPAKAVAAGRAMVAAAPKDLNVQRMFLAIVAEARDYATLATEADRLFNEDKQRWWAVLARGIAKRYSSDKDGAVLDFEAALNLAQAQRNEAAAQEVINTIAREIGVDDALSRILPRAEKEPRWRFAAAQLYLRKGDYDRAAEAAERLLSEGDKLSAGERLQVLRFAGMMYQTYQPQPMAEKAYQAYLKVLDAEPHDWGTLNNMACLVAEQVNPPRPKEALQYSQKAYDLMNSAGRRDPLIYDTHGWVLTLNDRPQEGIDVLRQAVAMHSFPEGHYHLGEAYLRAAAGEEAQKQLELAAEMLRQADEKKQPIDLGLKNRVDSALNRVKELNRSKSANASP